MGSVRIRVSGSKRRHSAWLFLHRFLLCVATDAQRFKTDRGGVAASSMAEGQALRGLVRITQVFQGTGFLVVFPEPE